MGKEFKIIFIGTPDFGAIILEKLVQNDLKPNSGRRPNGPFRPILVITESDKPAGRGKVIVPPPVKVIAEKNNIPIEQPDRINNLESKIKDLNPDLIIVAAYGQMIPKTILDLPKYGCLNIHPSLLPKYRGASPIQYAILNGDKETGVTILLIDELVDHGAIVANSKWQITNNDTYESLSKELAKEGADLLAETIPDWVEGKIKAVPQNDSKATFTKMFKKEDGKIDWTKSAEEIERQIRALDPWPGTFTFFEEKGKELKLKILKAGIQQQTEICPSGVTGKTFMATNEKIAVQTGKDFFIIDDLQLEGKKPTTARDFFFGHPDFIGTILK